MLDVVCPPPLRPGPLTPATHSIGELGQMGGGFCNFLSSSPDLCARAQISRSGGEVDENPRTDLAFGVWSWLTLGCGASVGQPVGWLLCSLGLLEKSFLDSVVAQTRWVSFFTPTL